MSTRDQKVDLQVEAAKRLGVQTAHIYIEKASGARHDRPVLAKALAELERGDTLACFKLDRIGRSVAHLSKLLNELEERGIRFRAVDGDFDTRTSNGKLLLHVLSAVAQFERDLILERTRAGLAVARSRGRRLGPPLKWQPDMARRALHLMEKDGLSGDEAARVLGVSRRTLFRGLKAAREHDEIVATGS